jgi:hypothetical protein
VCTPSGWRRRCGCYRDNVTRRFVVEDLWKALNLILDAATERLGAEINLDALPAQVGGLYWTQAAYEVRDHPELWNSTGDISDDSEDVTKLLHRDAGEILHRIARIENRGSAVCLTLW